MADVCAPAAEGPASACPQRAGLLRAAVLLASVAAGTAALTLVPAPASAEEPTSAAGVVLPGPVAPGRAPLTAPAPPTGQRNPFAASVAPAPDAPMTLEEAVRIAPPAAPVSRSGRNPFLALVTAEAAGGARPTDLPATTPSARVLSRGAAGEDVRDLQTRLAELGLPVTADGSYGPQTVAAVTAFQTRRRLTVDGITGPETWAALRTP